MLGTSGYDYYHIDDLEKVVACHEARKWLFDQPLVVSVLINNVLFVDSDAERRRDILLLSFPNEGTTMVVAPNEVLHHISSVEFQARVHRLHSPCCKVSCYQYVEAQVLMCARVCNRYARACCSYVDVMQRMRESPGKDEEKQQEGERAATSDEEPADGEKGEESGNDTQPSATVSQSGLPASWSPSKSSGELGCSIQRTYTVHVEVHQGRLSFVTVNRSPRYGVRSADGSPSRTIRGRSSSMGGPGSDCTSVSADSPASRHSQLTMHSNVRTNIPSQFPVSQFAFLLDNVDKEIDSSESKLSNH